MKVWIGLTLKTIRKAIEALLMAGDHEHDVARKTSGEEAQTHRAHAEEFHAAKHEMWEATHDPRRSAMKNCSDDSVHGNSAPVQITRFHLPKDAREILIGTLLALSILVNVALWFQFRHLEQTVDLDRYDDNTFINGRFAELASQVKADHDLIQAYGLQKSLKEH